MANANKRKPSEVQALYEQLGKSFNFTTTSTTRTPEENARVHGVANSQHLDSRGTARDWSVKGKSAQEVEAFAAALREQGFEVITKPHGTGPHVHAELPSGVESERAAVSAVAKGAVRSLTADEAWKATNPRPVGPDPYTSSVPDPLAAAVKHALPPKAPEWAQNAADSIRRTVIANGGDLDAISKQLYGNEVAAAEELTRATTKVPFSPGVDNNRVSEDIAKQQAEFDAQQQDATLKQFASQLWGESSFSKNLWDMAAESPWHDAPVPEYTEPGMRYVDNMAEWEKGRTPDEVDRLRQIGASSFSREDIAVELARQDRVRKGQKNMQGWGTTSTLGMSLILGTAGDPIGTFVGVGAFKAFEAAGIGARAAFKAGQVAKGLALGGAEAATGNLALMGGMDMLGQQYSASDYLTGALFGASIGLPLTALGIKGARVEAALEAHAKLRSDHQAIVVARMEQFRTMAQKELGPDATEAAITARASELDIDDALTHATRSVEARPDNERLLPEPLDDAEAPAVEPVAPPAKAEPAMGDMTRATDGKIKWSESVELRAAVTKAEEDGSVGNLLRTLSQETGTPEHMRTLAAKLADIVDATGMQYVKHGDLEGEAANWAGVYFRDTNQMAVKMARWDIILHEALHGATSNILTRPKVGLTPALRAAVSRVEDLQGYVRVKYGELPESVRASLDGPTRGILDDGVHGPLGNVQEFVTYAMTDKGVQKFLASIEASGMKAGRGNLWQQFKAAVADMLGLNKEQATALDEVLEASGNLVDEVGADLPNSSRIIKDEARRSSEMVNAHRGDVPEEERLLPPGAMLKNKKAIDVVAKKYGLDATISDNVERAVAAEMYARAERVLEQVPIDKERLKPLLSKVGWEATSTRMLLSENPVMRAAGVLLLENPEGAGGRRLTAALAAHVRDRQFRSIVEPEYESTLNLYAAAQGQGKFRTALDPEMKEKFDRAVQQELEARWHDQPPTTDNAAVLHMADVFDLGHQRMAKDAIGAKIIGWARMPLGKRGYYSRVMRGDRLVSMTPQQLRAAQDVLSEEFQTTAGFDAAFSDKLSVKYMEIAMDNARGSKLVSLDLRSPDTADVVRDSIKAMGYDESEADKLLGRFSRGGARMTRSRIDINLNATRKLEDGTMFRLGDLFETDLLSLYKNYSRRMSGEIALTQFGIMGAPGVKTMRKAIQSAAGDALASNKELDAFDQAMGELLGMKIGDGGGSVAMGNARAAVSAVYLGGMGWTQLTEYGNAIHAVGYGGMFRAISDIPRLYKEARLLSAGKEVENGILQSVEVYNGTIGTEQYRLIGLRDVGNHAEYFGTDKLGMFSLAMRGARHAVRVLSMQRAIEAVQVRGLSEQIVRKAFRFVREGKEDLALDDMGLTKELRAAMLANMDATTKWNGSELVHLDLTQWEDQFMARTFAAMVERGSSQIIQKTYAGEVGKWAHSDHLRLLTQFRDYPIIATQKQWRRVKFSQGQGRAVGFVLGSLSVTIPLYYARMALQSIGKEDGYFEAHTSPLDLARASMRYTSALGLSSDVFDVVTAPFGLTPYAGRSGVSGSIPAISFADQIARTSTQWAGRSPNDKAKEAWSLMPGNGIPGVSQTMNWLLSDEP